jgi:hypothetical protein
MKTGKQLFLLLILIVTYSCSNEEDKNLQNTEIPNFVFEESRLLENYQIPKEDVISLQKLGFSGSSGVAMERTDYLHNETYMYYLMENDIVIRKDALPSMSNELSKNKTNNQSKQYHTTNLVDIEKGERARPRFIKVIAVNFTEINLIKGLTMAIKNYNDLKIGLKFTLEFRYGIKDRARMLKAEKDSDILVNEQFFRPPGGDAGFPSGGMPYGTINVGKANASFGIDVCEHIFTHEIGHCIGLRHTDFFNRSISCEEGSVGNEGESEAGAIHIPGTPKKIDIDLESIMLSCADGGETGEFSNDDVTALNYLYKQ